jgi:hypothetical protein
MLKDLNLSRHVGCPGGARRSLEPDWQSWSLVPPTC